MGIFEKFKLGFKKSAENITSGLREIIIKNYRQKERVDEIINTATWSLTRMMENSV